MKFLVNLFLENFKMSVLIKSINRYQDGETIGIDCWISYCGEILEGEPPLITIENSIDSENKGEWYFGWKHKGGKLIDDVDFKQYVIKGIEEHIQQENSILNKIKDIGIKN